MLIEVLIEVLALGCGFRLRRLARKFPCPILRSISTAQARTKFAARISRFQRHRFTGCPCTFSDMKSILHGRRKESLTFGGLKREFAWQVQGIGHVSEIMAGAVYRGRC